MSTDLTNQKVSVTYDQLLHVDDGPTAEEKTVYGGAGVPTALKLGTESVSVDNVRIDGSTISTIEPGSDLVLAANNGQVQIDNVNITGGQFFGVTPTQAGVALLDDVDAAAQRTTLGLGTMATQDANNVNITGGTFFGVTPTAAGVALLDDADAAAQRTTLGLGTMATQNANNVNITGGQFFGVTPTPAGVALLGASDVYEQRSLLKISTKVNRVLQRYVEESNWLESYDENNNKINFDGISDIKWVPELGLFVGTLVNEYNGAIFRSPDGIKWTFEYSNIGDTWHSVAWSPKLKLLVAVGYGFDANSGRIARSFDGINWTIVNTPSNREYNQIIWVPELDSFFAFGSELPSAWVMTSPDGVNWTETYLETTSVFPLRRIAWSPKLNLFVSPLNLSILTSNDGINWEIRNTPLNNYWYTVIWASELDLFVAVGGGNFNPDHAVVTSFDGINWTVGNTPNFSAEWMGVAWSPELHLFVAVAYFGDVSRLMTSNDGINWTARDVISKTNNWSKVIWASELGLFIAGATYGGVDSRIVTSVSSFTYPYRAA